MTEETPKNPPERESSPLALRPRREMTFLGWDDAIRLAEAHNDRYRALIYVAVDSGMRWSDFPQGGPATHSPVSGRYSAPWVAHWMKSPSAVKN